MLEVLKLKIGLKDEEFDSVYPEEIRKLSYRHFTPFEVARKVSAWLNDHKEPLNLIDLGSGVGKFCLVAAAFTHHKITGVDFRKNYIELCNKLNSRLQLKNLSFIHKDITTLNFRDYNAFYFYNSFLEQLDPTAKMDDRFETSQIVYSVYTTHLKNQLAAMPAGTVLITYYVVWDQVPFSYELVKQEYDGALKMWIKS
jgi:predicted RNA methylase